MMGKLPERVAVSSGLPVIGLTPFHRLVGKMPDLQCTKAGSFGVTFDGRTVIVNLLRHDAGVPWYFIQPEDPQFFAGDPHPYQVPPGVLLRDSLFFGAAAAEAVHVIKPGGRWSLLLQDWEAATTALAFAGHPGTHRNYLTLHNSYDCETTAQDLWRAGMNPQLCPGGTILQRALGLAEYPVSTVSDQFASDLTEDVLQAQILASHLRETLRPRLIGIDNGPFAELAVPPELLQEVDAGSPAGLRAWKARHRAEFLTALAEHTLSDEKPLWGDRQKFLTDDAPWFMMAGRDDARQKGYDIAVHAASEFLAAGGKARFLFFPIPGDEGHAGLDFLHSFANRHPEHVLAVPFRFNEGFLRAMRGATFALMPSLYEPFGMANEFYLNGTPCIGRATGGLLQQIVPLRAAASHGRSVQIRAARWSTAATQPTGLLFRERDGLFSEVADWKKLNAGLHGGATGEDRVQHRRKLPLFHSMAEELRRALFDATRILPTDHDRMIVAGIRHIQQTFSWDRAAGEYVRMMSVQ